MKTFESLGLAALIVSGASTALFAQSIAEPKKHSALERNPDESRHRFGLRYQTTFNVGVNLSNRSGVAPVPGFQSGGIDHTYDDGSVLVDSSGNFGGKTWNWAYTRPEQIVGDRLVLSAQQTTGGSSDEKNDFRHGVDLSYGYRIGGDRGWGWGLEIGFSHFNFDENPATGSTLLLDAYALDGIAMPSAPYAGSFGGPGPLISDSPTRLVGSMASSVDASFYGFRIGPFVELPVTRRGTVVLGVGVSLLVVESDFSYSQSATVPGGGLFSVRHETSDSGLLAGGYLSAAFVYRLNDYLNIQVGVQYQKSGTFDQDAGDKKLELDLDSPVSLSVGLGMTF